MKRVGHVKKASAGDGGIVKDIKKRLGYDIGKVKGGSINWPTQSNSSEKTRKVKTEN